MESNLNEKEKQMVKSKQSKDDDDAACEENEANIAKEMAVMMATKEQ